MPASRPATPGAGRAHLHDQFVAGIGCLYNSQRQPVRDALVALFSFRRRYVENANKTRPQLWRISKTKSVVPQCICRYATLCQVNYRIFGIMFFPVQ